MYAIRPYVIHAIIRHVLCQLLSLLGIAMHVLHFVYTFILSDIIDLKYFLISLSLACGLHMYRV